MGYSASNVAARLRKLFTSRFGTAPESRRARRNPLRGLENLESRLLLSSTPVIAVLDTGLTLTDPAVASHVYTNPKENLVNIGDNDVNGFNNDVHGYNFVAGTAIITDATGHGTAMASAALTAAQQTVATAGQNSGVLIMPVVTQAAQTALPTTFPAGIAGNIMGVGTAQNLIDGINYAIRMKQLGRANIVAMTIDLGGYYIENPNLNGTTWAINNAIDRATGNGIIVVTGSGNGGNNNDVTFNFPANYSSSDSTFLSIAAVDATHVLQPFSNYGKNTVQFAIVNTSGTEYAAAELAGTIAGLAQLNPGRSTSDILSGIYKSLTPVAGLAATTATGAVLDPATAGILAVGNRLPVGYLDSASLTQVAGWAYDPELGGNATPVKVYVDGSLYATVPANGNRADLTPLAGSPNHGFIIPLQGLSPTTTHTVTLKAVDYPTNTEVTFATTTVANRPPVGAVDALNTTTVTGWTADLDDPSATVFVRIDVDGIAGAAFQANTDRPDLTPVVGSPNHGFTYTLPALSPGFHRVDVNVYDTATGAATLLNSSTVSTNTTPFGYVDVANGTTVSGWAFSPTVGAGPINVRIDIDGVPFGVPLGGPNPQIVANLPRPDVGAIFGSPDHGFVFNLPQLTPGNHTINAFAIDPNTLQLAQLPSPTINHVINVVDYAFDPLPIGYVDSLNANGVSGWAFDTQSGDQPLQVRIDVDGATQTTLTADGLRFDVGAVVGSANHGYSYSFGALSAGSHRVDVYYIDPQTGTPMLRQSKIVPGNQPTGYVDILNAGQILGWAYSPDNPTAAIQVRVDIDGQAGTLITANRTRLDLGPVLGSTNHAFVVNTPHLGAGRHSIIVKAINPNTLDAITIGSGVLTT